VTGGWNLCLSESSCAARNVWEVRGLVQPKVSVEVCVTPSTCGCKLYEVARFGLEFGEDVLSLHPPKSCVRVGAIKLQCSASEFELNAESGKG